jgi:hypothetical protein
MHTIAEGLKPIVPMCTSSLNAKNSAFCPHSVFTCFVWMSRLTAFISLYVGQDSSVGIVAHSMGWTVQGLIPGGGEIFRTCPDQPWGPPNLLYNGYWVSSGGNRPGCGVDHLSPSSAEVKKRVELYIYYPFGLS